MKKILITGATGFLGSRLVEKMSTIDGLKILATGRTLKDQNIFKKSNVEYILGDLEDNKFIDSVTSGIDAVIHTAALTNVDGCEKQKIKAKKINYQLTKKIANLCKKYSIKLIYISTDHLFSGKKNFVKRVIKHIL